MSKSVASLKTQFKALQKDGEGYYVDLNELTTREEQENLDLQQLLEAFGTLFEELKGLPPSRSHDHAIRLIFFNEVWLFINHQIIKTVQMFGPKPKLTKQKAKTSPNHKKPIFIGVQQL